MTTITATQAEEIIKNQIRSLEKSGDTESAIDLSRVLFFTNPMRREEFMALPLAEKCQFWRVRGSSDEFLGLLCVSMIDLALGDGWRDDPAIREAIRRNLPVESPESLEMAINGIPVPCCGRQNELT